MDESLNDYVIVVREQGGKVRFAMERAASHEDAGSQFRAKEPGAEVMTIGLFEEGDRSEP